MKTLVSCPHCNAKYKAMTDHVPDHGRPAPCPLCGKNLILWKPDAYYLENIPLEIATFLLFRKHTFPHVDARRELECINQLKEWLNEQHKTLGNATTHNLTDYLDFIEENQSPEECQETRQTLQQFYTVLAQKNFISTHPLPLDPENASSASTAPHTTQTNWKPWAVVALVLLVAGVVLFLPKDKPTPPPLPGATALQPIPTKVVAVEETPPPLKEDPRQVASKQLEAEVDRWAHEVVKRAELIRQADRAILKIRKEKELSKTKPPPPKTVANPCLSGNCRNGTGTFQFDNGDTYNGEWSNGLRHGTGTYTYVNGERYSGQWRNNHMEGQGSFTYLDGTRYDGEWLNNQRHGHGTLTQPNGDKYVGNWRNDSKFGPGTKHLIFADYLAKKQNKRVVETQRARTEQEQEAKKQQDQLSIAQALEQGKKGCIQGSCDKGKGVYIYANGDHYSGDWLNGDKHGQGTYIFKSGDSYAGSWYQNKKHGQGTYRFKSGQSYEGDWWLNKKHGQGTVTFPNGLRLRGLWNNGEQVQN